MRKVAIIPAYKEEKNIEMVISKIMAADKDIKIAVIDDGSPDNTAKTAKSAGAVVLRLPFNMGYGSALQTGYKYALENNYDIVVQLDADGQHDPAYIPDIIDALVKQKADIVIGSRFKAKTSYRTSVARRAGIAFFGIIVSALMRKKITDPTSGYRAIGAAALVFLVSESFPCDFPDADLLLMLYSKGFKIEEIPMEMRPAPDRDSMHSGFIKNIYYVIKMLLSILLIILSFNIFKKRS